MENETHFSFEWRKSWRKHLFFAINLLYLILSVLMISGAATHKILLRGLIRPDIDILYSIWIAIGYFLFVISLFGIATAIKGSLIMTKTYIALLTVAFVVQMAATIFAFKIMSTDAAWWILSNLMWRYKYEPKYRYIMDWIQFTLSCCGVNGPSDWNLSHGWDTSPSIVNMAFVRRERGIPLTCCCEYRDHISYKNMNCSLNYATGCLTPLGAILSKYVTALFSCTALLGIFEIFGIICSCMLAKAVRRNESPSRLST